MKNIHKRDFLKMALLGMGYIYGRPLLAKTQQLENISKKITTMNEKPWKWSTEVLYYEKKGTFTICKVCPHNCIIKPNEGGFCKNKVNYNGKLFSLAYGNPCTINIDPIEKKPMLHFKPQTITFSLAAAGCNFRCLNCQNWSISQFSPIETRNHDLSPQQIVEQALKNNCTSISYTYSEPVVFYEYMLEIAKKAKAKGIANVLVSNGYINEKPLRDLAPYLDAANIDLKTFDETKHFELTKGNLEHVLRTLKILNEAHVWVEITNLIIPQWSDDMDTIKRMCDWLVANNLEHFPLHFSRFSPMYKLTHLPATPISILEKAHAIAKTAGIKYVYIGNVPGHETENTVCSKCSKIIIERKGYTLIKNDIKNNACSFCNEKIDGVWL